MRFLIFLFIVSCTTAPAVVTTSPTHDSTPDVHLSWEVNHPERAEWSAALLKMSDQVFPKVKSASDIKRFCPGYASLSDANKKLAWAELIIQVAYFESSWNPHSIYHEPPPLSVDSVGLLQLSYEDTHYKYCELNRASKSLEDPIKNLQCGFQILAQLTEKYGAISTPANKGAAAYWSTLRESRKLPDVIKRMKILKVCAA